MCQEHLGDRCGASRSHPNPSPTAGDCWYHIPPPPKQRLKQVSVGHTSVFALDENGKWLLIPRGHPGRGVPEHPNEMRSDPYPPKPQHETFMSPVRAASLSLASLQALPGVMQGGEHQPLPRCSGLPASRAESAAPWPRSIF